MAVMAGGGMAHAQSSLSFQDGASPSPAYAGTRDTRLKSGSPNTNYGTSDPLNVDGGAEDISTLLKWDLGSIPPGSSVNAVSITVNVTNASTVSYEVYEVLRAWVEGNGTMGSGASWNVFDGTVAWEAAGAQGGLDRSSTPVGVLTASALGPHTFSLNANGVAVVQGWVNNPGSNRGLIVQDYAGSNALAFNSRENAAPANRPRLTVVGLWAGAPSPAPTASAAGLPDLRDNENGNDTLNDRACGFVGAEALAGSLIFALLRLLRGRR